MLYLPASVVVTCKCCPPLTIAILQPVAHEHMEVDEEGQTIPPLTLKVPQGIEGDYTQPYSDLNTSFNSYDDNQQYEAAPPVEPVPRL